MEEEVKQTVDESTTTTVATTSETTTDTETAPFKIYSTQEEYDKDIKSLSMKRVNALYTELGIKSKDDIKVALENSSKFSQLESEYATLKEEFEKYKASSEASSKERDNLSKQLVMTKLNISDDKDTQEDFLAGVENLMARKNIGFEDAATEYVNKYPVFRKSIVANSVKIGVDKSGDSDEPISGVEKAFAKINTWYKPRN